MSPLRFEIQSISQSGEVRDQGQSVNRAVLGEEPGPYRTTLVHRVHRYIRAYKCIGTYGPQTPALAKATAIGSPTLSKPITPAVISFRSMRWVRVMVR